MKKELTLDEDEALQHLQDALVEIAANGLDCHGHGHRDPLYEFQLNPCCMCLGSTSRLIEFRECEISVAKVAGYWVATVREANCERTVLCEGSLRDALHLCSHMTSSDS